MLTRAAAVLAVLAGAGAGPAPAAASLPPLTAVQVRAAEMAALTRIGVPAAWKLSRGRGVTVGVLDTGVNPSAPGLAGSVTTGPDYTKGADPAGYRPPHLHGTYIASLIAGHGSGPGRTGGVIGVAPRARILSVRVLLDDGEPGMHAYNHDHRYANAVGKGIRYAVRHGAQVINMSLGSLSPGHGTQAALDYAVSRGVVVVASAGNSARAGQRYTPYSYPASFPGVISVAATGPGGRRASFSDHNASVVLSAPGVKIIGDGPVGDYLQASGTSPASAFVAGVAALIRSAYPRLPPALVEQALITSTRHRPRAGYSTGTGFGEVDAVAALEAARRLAGTRPATGVAASARAVAGRPAAIDVVHRDTTRIGALTAASVAGALAFLLCLAVLGLLAWRWRRSARDAGPGGIRAG